MSFNFTQASSGVRKIVKRFSNAIKPPLYLDLDEWADRFRVIPEAESSEAGLWRTSRFPFTREVMKALSPSSGSKMIVAMKGAQVAFTEICINKILYTIHINPNPLLYAQKTDDDIISFHDQKLEPSLRACKEVFAILPKNSKGDAKGRKKLKLFSGGFIALTGANTASGLRSRSIAELMLDEEDSYVDNLQGEGHPSIIAMRRTANFPRRKIFRLSTPKTKETSKIEPAFLQGDQRYFYLPCPFCNPEAKESKEVIAMKVSKPEGFYFVLKWDVIKWEGQDASSARCLCKNCGCLIDEKYKTWMLERGLWIAHNPKKENQIIGDVDIENISFHISALYSPFGFFSWKDAVEMFLEYKRTLKKEILKVFINTVLGETFSETGKSVDADWVENRREVYVPANPKALVPNGVYLLTAGCDVQGNRIECEVVGHGANEETWSIQYKVFKGDTEQDQVWIELDMYLQQMFLHENGTWMNIACTAIDSGHVAQRVYSFCKPREFRRIFPVKGRYGWGNGYINRPRYRTSEGIYLFIAYVDELKSKVYSQLGAQNNGAQYCHFPFSEEYDSGYFAGLTAETLKTERQGARDKLFWDCPKGKRNEPLDCRVYNIVAKLILNIDVNELAKRNMVLASNIQQQRTRKRRMR